MSISRKELEDLLIQADSAGDQDSARVIAAELDKLDGPKADFSGVTGGVQTTAGKAAPPSGIDVASWFTGKPSTKSLFGEIGDAILPNAEQKGAIRTVMPKIDAGDAFQHHVMNLPYGISQSLINTASYGADKLLGQDSSIAATMRNDANSFNSELAQREQQYQQRTPDNEYSYAGAAGGEVLPWVYGLPARATTALVNKIAPKGSGLLRRTAAGASVGGAMSATAPVTGDGGYGEQKLMQGLLGTGTGGAIPLTMSGLGGAYSGGKELFNMVARPDVIAQKNLARLYGSDQATIDKLRNAPQYFPDEQITAAQALQTPEAVMAEKAMRNRPELRAGFENMDNANNLGRVGILQKIAGTDEQLTGLLSKRKTEANTFANDVLAAGPENQRYAKAAKVLVDAKGPRMSSEDFDSLNTARLIMNRVQRGAIDEAEAAKQLKTLTFKSKTAQKSFDQAMTAVNKNMVNPANIVKQLEALSKSGNPVISGAANKNLEVIAKNADGTGKVPAFALDDIRQNLGKMLSDSAPNGVVGSVESAKYGPVSSKIINTLERTIPGYRDYLRAYRSNSQPINTIEAGRQILGPLSNRRLNSSGDQNLTLNDIAQGFKRDDKARYGMSPDARQALTGVQNSLQRRSISDSLRSAGSDTNYNLQADSWIGRNLLGPNLNGPTAKGYGFTGLLGAAAGNVVAPGLLGSAGGAIITSGLKKAADTINSRVSSRVGVGVMDSRKAADMIEEFLKKNPQNRRQLLEQYPEWVRLIGGSSQKAITQQ